MTVLALLISTEEGLADPAKSSSALAWRRERKAAGNPSGALAARDLREATKAQRIRSLARRTLHSGHKVIKGCFVFRVVLKRAPRSAD